MPSHSETLKGFLVDVDAADPTTAVFQFQWNPLEIKRSNQTTWASVPVLGHSNARLLWAGAGRRMYTMRLDWFLDDPSDAEWVKKQVAWLESVTYPEFDDTDAFKQGPHRLRFVFGQLIDAPRNTFVLTKCDSNVSLFLPDSLLPRRAYADIELTEHVETAVDYRIVRP